MNTIQENLCLYQNSKKPRMKNTAQNGFIEPNIKRENMADISTLSLRGQSKMTVIQICARDFYDSQAYFVWI